MKTDTKIKNEAKILLEQYQKYRTLIPLSEEEIRRYMPVKKPESVLNKDYKKILFGEDDPQEWKKKIIKIVVSDVIPADFEVRSLETKICDDISENKDGSVVGWVEAKKDHIIKAPVNELEYILHIDGDGKVQAPPDCTGIFEGFSKVKAIEFCDTFDTGRVTSMNSMFKDCSELRELDVSRFNTQNVTDMAFMFWECKHLTTLDVSGFDTRNVTNMCALFGCCFRLQELDVSGFDTRNVSDMVCMFSGCSALSSLDVSGFRTENVTNMLGMFLLCRNLRTLNVRNFITDKVIRMGRMFDGCQKLETLDVSGFNTQNVTDMKEMFRGCKSLQDLDISRFNMQKVTEMEDMFSECSSTLSAGIKLLREKKYTEAIPLLEANAEAGHAEAEYALGNYLLGLSYGLIQDKENLPEPKEGDAEKAFRLLEAAAGQGHAKAQRAVGNCYFSGAGTETDYKKAYEWYQKAAEQGIEVNKERMETAENLSRKGVFQKLKSWLKN